MKKIIKIYLEPEVYEQLKQKSIEAGFPIKRGWLQSYIRFLANQDIAFLNDNIKKVAALFKVEKK